MSFGMDLKSCSYCGYGYYVSPGAPYLAIVGFQGEQTVSCPSCGNVEKV